VGATYRTDYVELFNRSEAPQSLAGWTLQYASATGASWSKVSLSGTMAPGAYHLVALAGGSSGVPLPAADSSGSINMSATQGKIALRNSSTSFTGSTPIGQSGLQDFVGYGAANRFEGSGPAPAPSTTTAIFRQGGGATDTGDNAADFSVSSPNPRNSSSGVGLPPGINSPAAATGRVGQPFTYSITATNGPTSFGASPLPPGLVVQTSNGLISGIPEVAGLFEVTLSATNAAGYGSALLNLTIQSADAGEVNVLTEDFSTLTLGDNTTTTGANTAWSGNTNFPTVSSAYQAGGAVKLGSSSAPGSLVSRPLNLSANGGSFRVQFKVKGWTTVEGQIRVAVAGVGTQLVAYTSVMSGSFESRSVSFSGGVSQAVVRLETTAQRAYLDDVVVSLNAPPVPSIQVDGALAAVSTTYGLASPSPSMFTVSGQNLSAGILISAPPGFEVSQSTDGLSDYAATQTLGGAGTVGPAPVYLRLAAGTAAGSYAGAVICSSPGAEPVAIESVASVVRLAVLSIRAQNLEKPFGTVLTLGGGSSAFISQGLVLGETIGSVTVTADGGSQLQDAAGSYAIWPSAATGGTFDRSNYDIEYLPGTLRVFAPNFSEWIDGRPEISGKTGWMDDPDEDGWINLLEYFMRMNPGLADGPEALKPGVTGSGVYLEYRRSKALEGISGEVVWRGSLTDGGLWSADGMVDSLIQDHGEYETRRATLNGPVGSLHFLRLQVNQP
ncbi:MAG: lamin tail domain-containing protein, partial [Kiritimatiellia bacterium]|nr:lamin tail domain-containing protein [Kiritimatiellia bacterium]